MLQVVKRMKYLLKGTTMKRILITLLIAISPMLILATSASDAHAGFGVGLHYLKTVDDMEDSSGFDSSALGFLGVYSFGPGILNVELGVEYVPNYVFDDDLIQPSAYAFVGSFIYGGLGIGMGHLSGEWSDDPFFDLRAGVKITAFDFFASYRFQKMNEVPDLESDDLNSVTFGAILKF